MPTSHLFHSLPERSAPHLRVRFGEPEVEYRYQVEPLASQAFLGCVTPHLLQEVHDQDHPVSHIVTTYFDTPNRCLFQSSGRLGRARIRTRQYASAAAAGGAALIDEVCSFEIKMSIFESRRIARLVDRPQAVDEILHRGGWRSDPHLVEMRPLRRAARGIGAGKLEPVLTTYFRRTSYSAPGIRVTLDEDIAFARPAPLRLPGELAEPDQVFSRSPHLVLEVKLSAPAPAWLKGAMRILRMSGLESSKFHEGMLTSQRLDVLAAAARTPPIRHRVPRLFPFEHEPTYA